MKLSLNWLKDYVDPRLSTDELVHRLTMAGLEVEEALAHGRDTVLDLEITPNRPDCLNTIGLAREISAITAKNLKLPKIKDHKPSKVNSFSVKIEDAKDCNQYIATLINHVNIASSLSWLAERINAVGLKAINNAVDVTNFVLMEYGQPLHAFDFDKLEGGKIIVRRARQGESIITLDGIERKLDPSILVIADAKRPVAIAGIMGGKGTEITAATKNILLESAQFDMGLVRRASRLLGLKSDSSYRFERGVDTNGVLTGANRATDLLLELTKGQLAGRSVSGVTQKNKTHVIALSLKDIEGLLGTKVSLPQVKNSLTRLGLGVLAKKADFKITIPSFRGDLKQPVDIIEEVARVLGYDRLDVSFPHIQVVNITANSRPRDIRQLTAQVLLAEGYNEMITFSLISQKDLQKSNLSHLPVAALQNSLSNEHCLMRPSLLPSLLSVALTNLNRGQRDLKLFEIGKKYSIQGERYTLGILAAGRRALDWQSNHKDQIDFHDIKGALEAVLFRIGVAVQFKFGEDASFDINACAHLLWENNLIGTVGRVSKVVLNQWDIKANDIFFAEIDLESLFTVPALRVKYEAVSDFPAVSRDVSLALKKDIPYAKIKESCLILGGNILKSVNLIEEYTGDKIQAGHRGLVFSLVYQSLERTLREDEVNAAHASILKALTGDFGALLR